MNRGIITASVLSTLVTAGVAGSTLVPTAAAAAGSPTVTITKSGPYYEGQVVHVELSGFAATSAVRVAQCSDKFVVVGANACDTDTTKTVTTDANGAAATTMPIEIAGYSDANGDICDVTANNGCEIDATDSQSNENDAALRFLHGITGSKETGLTNGSKITVKANGYESDHGTTNGQYLVECSAAILKHITQALSYCDTGTLVLGSANQDGTVTPSKQMTIAAGNAWNAKGECDGTHSCLLVVTDNVTPKSAAQALSASGYTIITFAKSVFTSTATKTSLKPAHKSGKTGKKLGVTATVKPTKGEGAFGGKLTVTDNGKKVGSYNEPKTGVVKFSVKLAKGKNKIVAKYSGNKYFKASSATAKVTGR